MKEKNAEGTPTETCCSEEHNPTIKESLMKSSIRDKAEGTLHEAKGAIKEVAGKLTDNPKLQAEGTIEKLAGKAQGKVGQIKQVFGK